MAAVKIATATPLVLAAALVLAGCMTDAAPGADSAPGAQTGFYDVAPLNDPSVGSCTWQGRTRPFVFLESDYIRGYFEPTDLASYRRALPPPFTMPERPLIRIGFLDFYEMADGPTYLETEVAVLGMNAAQPGWVVLTLPVTNGVSCIGGRDILGLAKVVRRITLERSADRFVGTLYARGGARPDITLTVEIAEPGEAARALLRQASAYPQFGLLSGRVLTYRGSGESIAELARRGDYEIRLGLARLEFPAEPDNLLQRLGVGPSLAAHWSRIRARYTIRAQ